MISIVFSIMFSIIVSIIVSIMIGTMFINVGNGIRAIAHRLRNRGELKSIGESGSEAAERGDARINPGPGEA